MRKFAASLILVFGCSVTYAQAIPSLVIPPSNEPTIVFSHSGKTFLIGQKTGKVTTLDTAVVPDYPVPQPTPANLQGLQKTIWDAFQKAVPAGNRKAAAAAFIQAVDSTTAQVGGLQLKGQQVIDAFVASCKANNVADLALGFKFGDILTANNVNTDEAFLNALGDLKTVMAAVK